MGNGISTAAGLPRTDARRSLLAPLALGAAATLAVGAGVLLSRGGGHATLARLLKVGGAAAIGAALLTGCGTSRRSDPASSAPPPATPHPGPAPASSTPTPTSPPTSGGAGPHAPATNGAGPAEPAAAGTLRIAQMNAHNLFDTQDGYGSDTIATPAEYEAKLGKMGLAIRDAMHGPDIIAMQEVENRQVLEDLAQRPEIRDLGYKSIIIEGTDPRGIDVAYLYRPSKVELVGEAEARGTTVQSATGRNIQLFTRPPLVATFRPLAGGAGDARSGAITLINNHFTSKLQGTDGEEKRRLQSAWVSSLANGSAGVANLDPARVIVLGDLNAGLDEDAYRSLVDGTPGGEASFVNAASHVPETTRYSFRVGSKRDLLDHVLMTPSVDAQVARVQIPHINSDPSERYYEDPSTYLRTSDHDPVLVDLQV